MTPAERRAALEVIAAEVRGCTRCRLHLKRTQAVPGEGDPETEVLFVGEGPGFHEDRQGRPFVGAAGKLLNELLTAIGWPRRDVFITNVVKCRPPDNRDPEPDEIAACAPYLRRQLEVLDPAVVVTLGRHSLQTFIPGARIGATHGTRQPVDPATGAADATAYAMYHPAAALRQGSLRQTMLADMTGLPAALLEARERRRSAASTDSTPQPLPPEPASQQPAALPESAPEHLPTPVRLPVSVPAGLREPMGVAGPNTDPENQMELF
ncbi:uracil-DNA glycosylase [soil metagenome]